MTSRLISHLYLKVISQRDIGRSFDSLLRQLTDLILDTPEAPTGNSSLESRRNPFYFSSPSLLLLLLLPLILLLPQ
jgi:hypothetical protein